MPGFEPRQVSFRALKCRFMFWITIIWTAQANSRHFSSERRLYTNLRLFYIQNLIHFTNLYKASKYCVSYPRWCKMTDYSWKSLRSQIHRYKNAQNLWTNKLLVQFLLLICQGARNPLNEENKAHFHESRCSYQKQSSPMITRSKSNSSFTDYRSVPSACSSDTSSTKVFFFYTFLSSLLRRHRPSRGFYYLQCQVHCNSQAPSVSLLIPSAVLVNLDWSLTLWPLLRNWFRRLPSWREAFHVITRLLQKPDSFSSEYS